MHVHYEDSVTTLASYGCGFVNIWWEAPSLASAEALEKLTPELRSKNPKGIVVLNVITDAGGAFLKQLRTNFNSEAREKFADVTKLHSEINAGTAHVVLVKGLRGMTTRSVLSTMMLVSKAHVRPFVCDSVGSGCEHLQTAAASIGATLDVAHLQRFVESRIASRGRGSVAPPASSPLR